MSADYLRLPAINDRGLVHVVVEAPKGARAKLKYEPRLGSFFYSRPLAAGLSYPFDWGFVPSTCAPDGDPLDAIVIHEAASYPGTVIPCRPLAVLEVEQTEDGTRRRNDRLALHPAAAGDLELSPALKAELELFFVQAVHGTGKTLHYLGWRNADAAQASVRAGMAQFNAGS